MHRPQLVTWTTHTAETTTLLDYRKLYTYMCNIVTEFYLYSIVYIYLINSRLDVTFSVRHHFRMKLYQPNDHGSETQISSSLKLCSGVRFTRIKSPAPLYSLSKKKNQFFG